MKKLFVFLFLALVIGGMAFADGYTVQGVTGKVEREVSPGKWEAVKAGSVLSASAVINTGLNSSLVLKDGDRVVTIRAMQKGAVEALIRSNVAAGVRIGGTVSESNTAAGVRSTSNVSTASTRASDAAEDIDWAE
ncbi:MAG: hypothetical protein LBK08_12825 [Treponema sp.]|jgi:hypothetical protein|nr:hypothetical protein [Treponema sp.]